MILCVILFPLLLAASAFFSSSETAAFSLDPLRARRLDAALPPAAAERVRWLLSKPTRRLSTILVGNTIVNIALSNVGYLLASRLFPGHAEAVAVPAVTVLLVFFGEIGPKRVALHHAERLFRAAAPVLAALTTLFTPLRALLDAITDRFAPLFRPRGKTLSEEEFETILDISREDDILNTDELAMIKAIVDLEDLHASDVMTPRVDFAGIDLDDPAADPAAIARSARKNFLIVYRSHFDDIDGFLDVRRYLLDPARNLSAALIPPVFVPESVPLNRLLSRFCRERLRIAAVADEYGGVAGLVTRGDILEEITGDIYNELSKPRPVFQPAGPHAWLVDANISLEELNRKLRIRLEAETSDRLAGWIAERLGAVPVSGDVVEVPGIRVRVTQTLKRRVLLAHVEKLSPDAPSPAP